MAQGQREVRRFIITTKDKKNNKIINIIWIFVGILAVYLLISVIFSFITLPNTYINGTNVSYASKESALEEVGEDFTINISGRNEKNLLLNSKDINYEARIPEQASIDQNPLAWPLYVLNAKADKLNFDYDISYDKEKLDSIIKDSALFTNVKEPSDAKVVYKDGSFQVEEEVLGDELDYDKVKDVIVSAILENHDDIVLTDEFYKAPSLLADSDEVKNLLADGEKIQAMNIGFNFNGFDIKLDGDELVNMVDQEGSKFVLNYDKVSEFVADVASQTDTYGTERKFNATGIGEIVVNPGVYGYTLDQAATSDEVYKLFNERKSGDIEPVYQRFGYERTDKGTDIGDTYIEVDLSRQHLWFYRDGEVILESPFVSGITQDNWQTNVGVGAILEKNTNATLRGVGFEGEEYATPVDYWMPIGWDGEGFHDAPWRGSNFGGNIYNYDGSHGCINLPPETARFIFEKADNLTPVVVYESSTNYSPAMMY